MDKLAGKLGRRAFAIPFGIAILLLCILGLAMFPMMHMEAKNIPVAVLNLDAGTTLPNGETLNAGDKMVENMESVSSGSEDSPMKMTQLDSRSALNAAMDEGEYFAALVIPENFTQDQMAGQTALSTTLASGLQEMMAAQAQAGGAGAGAAAQPSAQAAMAAQMQTIISDAVTAQRNAEKPTIELIVNTPKSPMVAQTLQQSLTSMLTQAGVQVKTTSIGNTAGESESANPISSMMGVQMMSMPTIMLSLIMSLFAVILLWFAKKRTSIQEKAKLMGAQIAFVAIASLVAAICSYGIVAWFGGVEVPAGAILYLWVVSAFIMIANVGLCDLCLPLGALVMICVFAFGMSTAVLPVEMLPSFWADWVAPWAPQVTIGDGLRNIIYLGGNGFEAGFGRIIGWACAGIIAMAIALFVPARKAKGSDGGTADVTNEMATV